jgi:hypothetical protein
MRFAIRAATEDDLDALHKEQLPHISYYSLGYATSSRRMSKRLD